jgi:hypothetical protein
MRHFIILAAVCAAAISGCASNSTADADAAAAGDQVAASGEQAELICERVKTTGTRFTEKVCMTEEQWEAKRAAMQEGGSNSTREWQRRGKMANDGATNIGG